jgi:DNA-binding transcriptional MerR regulator
MRSTNQETTMRLSAQFLNSSEAASRLDVSVKALRLYERRGLITPARTEAGYRAYSPDEMSRAAEIVSLRALGFSLAQVARVLQGDANSSAVRRTESLELANRPVNFVNSTNKAPFEGMLHSVTIQPDTTL